MGDAFSREEAVKELEQIASDPPKDYVFKEDTFEALENIQEKLQERIFSVEGTDVVLQNNVQNSCQFLAKLIVFMFKFITGTYPERPGRNLNHSDI